MGENPEQQVWSVLTERSDVVAARIQFFRNIKRFREEGCQIIYTDETYVHSSHSVHRSWQSSDVPLQIPFSGGECFIVVHAGTDTGFIGGAALVFKAHSATGDYHNEMNRDNFLKWLKEKLIPNLPERSVLVVDNAPYHNLQVDKCS